jgi:hypothetical protein
MVKGRGHDRPAAHGGPHPIYRAVDYRYRIENVEKFPAFAIVAWPARDRSARLFAEVVASGRAMNPADSSPEFFAFVPGSFDAGVRELVQPDPQDPLQSSLRSVFRPGLREGATIQELRGLDAEGLERFLRTRSSVLPSGFKLKPVRGAKWSTRLASVQDVLVIEELTDDSFRLRLARSTFGYVGGEQDEVLCTESDGCEAPKHLGAVRSTRPWSHPTSGSAAPGSVPPETRSDRSAAALLAAAGFPALLALGAGWYMSRRRRELWQRQRGACIAALAAAAIAAGGAGVLGFELHAQRERREHYGQQKEVAERDLQRLGQEGDRRAEQWNRLLLAKQRGELERVVIEMEAEYPDAPALME